MGDGLSVQGKFSGILEHLQEGAAFFCGRQKKGKVDEPVLLLPCLEPHGKNISASALGEKPPSAMVPSILISESGDMLVIGGAGGGWIISATTMVSETHSKLPGLSALPDF